MHSAFPAPISSSESPVSNVFPLCESLYDSCTSTFLFSKALFYFKTLSHAINLSSRDVNINSKLRSPFDKTNNEYGPKYVDSWRYIFGAHSKSVSVSLASWDVMARSDKSCMNEIKVVCVSYWPTSLVRHMRYWSRWCPYYRWKPQSTWITEILCILVLNLLLSGKLVFFLHTRPEEGLPLVRRVCVWASRLILL
jgi:hypothetical protein